MNRGSWGLPASSYLYTYNIRIMSVKMNVKFQCKMRIQFQSEPITNQVSNSEPATYTFNQDCTLVQKNANQNCFILSISLTTSKGAKYIAGIAQLYFTELARAADTGPSSRVIATLSKCLDPQAIIEVMIRDAIKIQNPSNRNQTKFRKNRVQNVENSQCQSRKYQNSPLHSPIGRTFHQIEPGTRSQIPLTNAINNHRVYEHKIGKESTVHRRNTSREHNFGSRQKSQAYLHKKHFGVSLTDRDAIGFLPEQSVLEKVNPYKESYSKLKERLWKQEQNARKQHERRISLQSNETSMKIQAMKYKLKCEELQKSMVDKNGNIKKLQSKIQQLQKIIKGNDGISFVKLHRNSHQSNSAINLFQPQTERYQTERLSMESETAMMALESKVTLANRQLEELRSKVVKLNKSHAQKQSSLVKQLQAKKSKISQLQEQIASGSHKFPSKTEESLKLSLESQTKIITQLEKQNEEYLKKVAEENRTNKSLEKEIQGMKSRIDELTKQLQALTLQKSKLFEQCQFEKSRTNLAQFSVASLKKNIQKLQNELKQSEKLKQKYQNCLIDMKSIEGELKMQQKNHQSSIKVYQNSISALERKYQQEIILLNRKNQQLDSKSIQQSMKIKELQTHINTIMKNQIDSYRKTNEKLTRQLQDYKNNERMSRKEQVNYQSKISQSNSEVEMWKNKFKSLENVNKLETDKYNSEINRLKSALEKEMMNQMNTKQKNQSLVGELALTSSKLNMIQEKYNRETKDLQQKLDVQSNKNMKLQQKLNKMEQRNTQIRDKQKQLMSKLEEYGQNQTQYSTLIKRYEQEISRMKSLLAVSQQKLNAKTQQSSQLSKQYHECMEKYNNVFQKNQQLNYELKNIKNQFEREEKEKQKIQQELATMKSTIQSKERMIEKQKSTLEQEFRSKSQTKEELSKIKMKLENTEKQYEGFKDHVYDILVRQFTGVDGLDSMAGFTIKNRDNVLTLRESLYIKNGIDMGAKSSREMLKNSLNNPTRSLTEHKQFETTKSTKTIGNAKSIHNFTPMFQHHLSETLSNNDIISAITEFSKESKALLNKMIEEYRILQKQLEYTKDTFHEKEAKYTEQLSKMQISIHKLEVQISGLAQEKQTEQKRSSQMIKDLQTQVQKLSKELQKKKDQIEETVFACNGMIMQKETQKQYYEMKINQNTASITKLELALTNLTGQFDKCEEENNLLKMQLEQKLEQFCKMKQSLGVAERKNKDYQSQLNVTLKLNEELNTKNKQLLTQVSQLQMQLSTEIEKNDKNLQIISQEQKKLIDSRQFVNNLIKQKEQLIKQDIAYKNSIIQLESAKMSLESQIESLASKLQFKTQELNGEKDNNKKLTYSNKDLENQVVNLKEANKKLQQDLKLKEKQLVLAAQTMKNKEVQYSKQIHTKLKEIKQINDSNQLRDKLHGQQVANFKKQIAKFEQEIVVNLEQQVKMMNTLLQNTQKEVQILNRAIQEKNYEINSYKELQERFNNIRQKQEQNLSQLNDQLRDKDEQLYNISGNLYSLQQKYTELERMSQLEREKIQEDFEYKYDAMCEDYETRIDELQKERDYFKQKLEILEDEQKKNMEKIRNLEYEETKERMQSKQKFNKIEEEKVIIINDLKVQIKKITQQREKISSQTKKKDIEIQKLRQAQKTNKTLNLRLETKLKQVQTKLEQLQSQLLTQVQNQKKREMYIKQYEQSVQNHQWILERQIKKELQNITKTVINSNNEDSEGKRKLKDTIKDVENRISRLVGQKIPIQSK